MATLFDGGLLSSFSSVFAFLFVYVLVYGLLSKIKLFGDKTEGLNAIFALCAGVFVLFSPMVMNMIMYMLPWFVIMLVIGLMIWVFPAYFGMDIGKQKGQTGETVVVMAMIIVIIILLIGFAKFYNPSEPQVGGAQVVQVSESISVSGAENMTQNITNPNPDNRPDWMKSLMTPAMLGVLLLLSIGGFMIRFMGADIIKK